jgi:hypothetical protein
MRVSGGANPRKYGTWSVIMPDLITIKEIARHMQWSYHRTRNTLNRNAQARALKTKLEYAVVYDRKVLEVLRAA